MDEGWIVAAADSGDEDEDEDDESLIIVNIPKGCAGILDEGTVGTDGDNDIVVVGC
ncbi:12536_t:CDS:2 [Entrophospora sp. SA101]|nr:9397_t:CDS:2 [Entrophospora candida]CAJ0626650.1 12536_t:CDS:2 [Entrophospora sp. SA101]CAJ0831908.1 1124_t:CDS:2 [Entrophospora sp. SA101]